MECPWLDERLQSLAVVAHSHALLCMNRMQLPCTIRDVVSLCIVAISFIPPTRFHGPFHACTVHFPLVKYT